MQYKKDADDKGFTLVELAIVMIIIGLLVGGVIKGQELMNSAKITRVAKDLQAFEGAMTTFRDQYKYYPGDFPQATTRMTGCTAANYCQDGDGNNIIGITSDLTWLTPLNSGQYFESYNFWKHLSLGDYITGVLLSNNPAVPVNGETTPTSPFGGKYEAYFDPLMMTGAGGRERSAGQIFRLSGGLPGQTVQPLLTPFQAASVDRKLDNGDPSSGRILANYGPYNDRCKSDTVYDETSTNISCVIYYRIQ